MLKTLAVVTSLVLAVPAGSQSALAQSASPGATAASGILNRDQAAHIIPATVFFRGQTASVQARNSSGVRLTDGRLMLASLVDTSGYSSGVAETYQAYLLTEVPLSFGGQVLKPGAYGFGFVSGDRFMVMDIGGAEVLHAATSRDAKLTRPTPLQIIQDGSSYRLYLGRSFISFTASPGAARVP